MALTPMRRQSIVGIYAGPSQAVRFFKRQPRIVSKHSTTSPRNIRVEVDRAFVYSEQLVASSADHADAMPFERAYLISRGPHV